MPQKMIGVVTIGQTPRPDITELAEDILGPKYKVIILGALDDLNIDEIPEFRDNEYLLMTGMRDNEGGRKGVRVTREFLVPLIQKRIIELEKAEVKIIVIWCAGRFPKFKSRSLVIRPCETLRGIVDAIMKEGRLGVIYPSKLQLIWAEPEWKKEGIYVYSDAPDHTHTRDIELKLLIERLESQKLDLILLNCTGFGYEMKKLIRDKTKIPVIQANALALRVVKELMH